MINRLMHSKLMDYMSRFSHIMVIYGARQVGKTSLLDIVFKDNDNVVWFNGDNITTQDTFRTLTPSLVPVIMAGKTIMIIDEAQAIENIGSKLKVIHDNYPNIKIVATGSSSFDLSNKINEPLTGRFFQFMMSPLMFSEMLQHHGYLKEKECLNIRLKYGYYPAIVTNPGFEAEMLTNLAGSYLYKDILMWENIRHSDKLDKLLKAVAYQIGSDVSYSELGSLCSLDSKTVEKYIYLLEKAFVIFRLPSYSRNQRNELKFAKKIYFYDVGIRNAVINNFSDIESRTDNGAIWENFIISERIKLNAIQGRIVNSYFWRTNTQVEIDYIEESDGRIEAYEFKWNPKKANVKVPKSFSEAYPNATFKVITPDNLHEFIC